MPKNPLGRPENQLLARLPSATYRRLLPHLQSVPFHFKQVLHQAGSPVEHAYFPYRGALSAIRIMSDDRAIEVATIGNEGMSGLGAVFGIDGSTNDVVVQIAGEGVRLEMAVLKKTASRVAAVRDLLARYHAAFQAQVSYSVACNGLHTIPQRCCRWLLMTRDRVESDDMPLTHEYLAIMLGVRRPSVTDVLSQLQKQGLVRNHRGFIHLLDRAGMEATACECYQKVRDEFERLLG